MRDAPRKSFVAISGNMVPRVGFGRFLNRRRRSGNLFHAETIPKRPQSSLQSLAEEFVRGIDSVNW
ncbi:MAG: hypothetical protein EBZ43_11695, partial [Betaproteobacteria bacterium]|nr:hypothetical protein [Betaproteobacteria bacterium]